MNMLFADSMLTNMDVSGKKAVQAMYMPTYMKAIWNVEPSASSEIPIQPYTVLLDVLQQDAALQIW